MRESYQLNRLYRDGRRAMVSGVCAGIARHFDINPNWVRGATAIAFVMAPFAVALAYVLAVLFLKTR
jgi:phage shock protein C